MIEWRKQRGHWRGIPPGSAQSTSRLHCAAESDINRIVAMGTLPRLLTGDDLNRAEPSPPPIKLQLEKDNASVTTAGGSPTQRIGRLNGEEARGQTGTACC